MKPWFLPLNIWFHHGFIMVYPETYGLPNGFISNMPTKFLWILVSCLFNQTLLVAPPLHPDLDLTFGGSHPCLRGRSTYSLFFVGFSFFTRDTSHIDCISVYVSVSVYIYIYIHTEREREIEREEDREREIT